MAIEMKNRKTIHDEHEAVSRIIQRLTSVGIIVPENLTDKQYNVIIDLCGLPEELLKIK